MESDRLLAEFRAQKKRAEDLEARNNQLELRLAESERMLARNGNLGGAAGRSTAGNSTKNGSNGKLMIGDTRGDRDGVGSLSEYNSSRSTSRGSPSFQRGGLPDALPSTEGRLTSSNMRDPISIGNGSRDLRGDPKSESQWRPVGR